ncbi:C4-dicarboxylate ABC transporter permease [Pacificitalea manganoxidans]|uniref:TRAP transporter large permease protein n=1 Tax=Pacificitalea manganoxidans TaxID=1411902 RepID=A0A291LYG4_9RHOB|nr:TRAP transporter large permease subunit [Pacificitalea manganoxidans]ATI41776.1 C4-dicarboxylate ABC transporter permease [Pacificitalea manganoxidans]MBF52766.1 C4-dicarboxylate ABC transporter permease [Actibacterium sp.]MDR6309240.1 tripartite ATP-independent transporter DctM subunit [Pacificitalea manganoxidans]OWU67531.1 C4-dicarboxylate ABC transporter permease [Roseovarius sp. 22II1-1F6A]
MTASVLVPFAILLALLGSGVWVGLGLSGIGILSLEIFRNVPVEKLLAQSIWNGLSSPELLALPLFILMAELLFRTKFIDGVFSALDPWLRNLPGGLLHTNIFGCALFALISGSSAATTSSIGRITVPELRARGYEERLVVGTLAGAGTLGFLIPPSIIMIVYGVLSQTSVLQLFAAGILPGLLLALCFVGYVIIRAKLTPSVVGAVEPIERRALWALRLSGLPRLLPFLVLILAVLGSMYGGIASPTEAAAFAVFATVVIMAFEKSLSVRTLRDAAIGTSRTVSMLGLIIASASFLTMAMGFLGMPRAVSDFVNGLDLSPLMLIGLLIVVYIVLGSFLEGMSIIVMTIPIVLPLVTAAGYDSLWFGIFLILMVELAQISPPVGMNLFVLQGLTRKPLGEIVRAALPFFIIMLLFVLTIAVFPGIVSVIPDLVKAG